MRPDRRGALHGRLSALEANAAMSKVIPMAIVHPDGHVEAAPGRRRFESEAALLEAAAGQVKAPLLIRLAPSGPAEGCQ